MAELMLFHHIQGRTPGIVAFADDLRQAGHTVHTPDLFDGRAFASIEDGAAFVDELGFAELLARGARAATDHGDADVFAGISLGVLPAQMLAQTSGHARAAVLIEGCAPVAEFSDRWPAGVAVHVHGMADDPFFAGEGDIDNARELVEQARDSAHADLFVYRGTRHLFTDRSLPSYDRTATELVTTRVLDLLAHIDE